MADDTPNAKNDPTASKFAGEMGERSVVARGSNFEIEYVADGSFTMRMEGGTCIYTPVREDATVNAPLSMMTALEDLPDIRALLDKAAEKIREQDERIKRLEGEADEKDTRIETLEGEAMTDAMTGLYNRKGFSDNFEREVARIDRNDSDGCVFVMLDLDKFKPINDTYGHQAGDACLKLVSDTLQDMVRDTDTVGRFGGDEFAVLMTNTTLADARPHLDKIRDKLNSLTVEWEGSTIYIGCSMGFAQYDEESGDFGAMYKKADAALYENKEMRRKWMGDDAHDRGALLKEPVQKPPKAKS